ncbi:MAG: hypothetical protein U0892_12015 [Pirellulales bacterium]
MGAGSTQANVMLVLSALEKLLRENGYAVEVGSRHRLPQLVESETAAA